MSSSNFDNYIHTSNHNKFWLCHQDHPIESVDHELFRSELKFPKSIEDVDPKLNSPHITETLASADYMIIPTQVEPEEWSVLQNTIIKWVKYVSIVFNVKADDFRYFLTDQGIDIHIPTGIFGLTPQSSLSHTFSRFIVLITLNSELFNFLMERYPSELLYTRLPNSLNPDSKSYTIEITYRELRNLDINDLVELSRQPRSNIKRKKTSTWFYFF